VFQGSLTAALARKGRYVDQGTALVLWAAGEEQRIFKKCPAADNALYSVEPAGLAFGRPKPALYLGAEFRQIDSGPCETFDSPALVEDADTGDLILDAEMFLLRLGREGSA
jgi:hypothetical protein